MGQHHGAFRIVAMLMITGLLLSSAPTNVPPSALAISRSAAPAAIGPVAPAVSTNSAPALRPRGIPPGSFVPAALRTTSHTRFSFVPPPADPSSPLLKFANSAASSEETGGESGGEHHPAFYANDDNPSTSWRPHPEAEGPFRWCAEAGASRAIDKFFINLQSPANFAISVSPGYVAPEVAVLDDTSFYKLKDVAGVSGPMTISVDGIGRTACLTFPLGVEAFMIDASAKITVPKDQESPTTCGAPEAPGIGAPFNPRTGFLWTSATDLRLPTGGPPLDWTRTYVSRSITETTGPLGVGWQFPYNTRLITPTGIGGEPGLVIVVAPDGNRWRFSGSTDNYNHRFYSLPGIPHTLDKKIKIDSTFLLTPTYELTTRQQQRWTYNNNGQLIGMQDAQGHQLTLTYTNTSQLERIADAENPDRYLALSYTDDRITQVSDGVRFVTYTYTNTGDLIRATDVMSRATDYEYQDHLLTKVTNALGQTVEETSYDQYTPDGRVITQTLLDGQQYAVDYQADATEITITSPDGHEEVQEYRYDESGTLVGTSVNEQVQSYSDFEEHLSPGSRSDANGNTTSTVFNQTCQPEAITNALGETTLIAYDSQSHPITITDTLGRQTVSLYDEDNNLLRQTLGITTSFPLGFTNFYTYTTDHRMLAFSGPDNVVTRNAYDAQGQVISRTIGYGTPLAQTSTYGYDRYGRVVTTTVGFATPLVRVDVTRYNHDDTIAETIQNYQDGIFAPGAPDEDLVTVYGYDGLGRPAWVRDVLGRSDVTHYDAQGRVDWQASNFVQGGWSGGALPTSPPAYSPSAPDRNVATFYGVDGLGRTAFVTETGILTGTFDANTLQFSQATQRVTRTEFDTLNRPVTVTLNYRPGLSASADRNVQLLTRYDLAGNVIGQRDALGRWTTTAYDALNRPITVTVNYENGDPLTVDLANQSWTDGSDTDIVSVTRYRPDGMVEQQIDNSVDGVFTATAPITDQITLFEYDALSRPITTTLNYDPPTLGTRTDTNRSSITAYDPSTMRVLGQRDALGRWVSQQYDLLGRVTTTVQNCRDENDVAVPTGCEDFDPGVPDRNVPMTLAYDTLGRTTILTDALEVATRTRYDDLDRSTMMIQNCVVPGTPTTAITNVTSLTQYDALGRPIVMADALGHATYQSYDGLSQTRIVTDTMGRVTRMGYDGQGALRWTLRPDGQITISQVDGLGRTVATIVNYDDGVVGGSEPSDQDLIARTVYDVGGRRVRAIDPANRATAFSYDQQDRLVAVAENAVSGGCPNAPCNVITQYRYDRAGNRIAIVDARGNVRTAGYDAAGQQVAAGDPVHPPTSWDYDRGGRVTVQHDPRGITNTLAFAYDGLDRRVETSAPNLSIITAQYDALGRRLSLDDATGTTSFDYDPLGRLTQLGAPSTGVVGYSYDANSRRTGLAYPGGTTLEYGYWPDGQIRLVTDTTTLASYAYDTLGRLDTVTRANGATTSYSYDSADRLLQSSTVVSGTTVGAFEYGVNRLGQRTVVTETLPLTTLMTSTLQTAVSYPAGTSPFGMALADFNADQQPDLAVTNQLSNTISVLLNLGDGSFSTPIDTPVGGAPYGIAAGELNGDGQPDLVVTNTVSNTISVLLGAGGGSFAAAVNYSVGTQPRGVALGDLNGDSHLDLVVARFNGISVWIGDGDGTFQSGQSYTTGIRTIGVALGDVNSDGQLDVAVALWGTGQVRVLLGNGDGTFQTMASYAVTQGTDAVAVADVNSDHRLDLIVTSAQFSQHVGVLLGNGDGTFQTTLYYSISDQLHTVTIGDFTGDGWTDIVVVGGAVHVLVGDGTGDFPTITTYSAGTSPKGGIIGDLNADGRLDVAVTNNSANTVSVLLSDVTEPVLATRVLTYTYDGLQRLTDADASSGASYAYSYDDVGNRTGVWVDGTRVVTQTHDAADQVVGYTYDAVGNLLDDGATTYDYDALNRLVQQGDTTNTYNGDSVLVYNGTTRYTQDLAAPLSQVLQTTDGGATTRYLYGDARLTAVGNGTRRWEVGDALSSVRLTLTESGSPITALNYDPWGQAEGGSASPFGFTGELQDPSGMVYLRARWYNATSGTFTSRDPFEGFAEQPYSLHPYQYGYSDPVRNSDPSGMKVLDEPGNESIKLACSQIRWLLDPKGCMAPTLTDLEALLKVLGPAGGSAEEDPNCIPYAQLEMIFPDGRHRCVVNIIAMQFGVLLDPAMVQMLMSEPICLQPGIVIESTGRTRLATEEDQGKGKGGPSGPGGPGGPGKPPRKNGKTLDLGPDKTQYLSWDRKGYINESWKDVPNDPVNFPSKFKEAADNASHIKFDIYSRNAPKKILDPKVAFQQGDQILATRGGGYGYSAWELNSIVKNKEWWDITTFYYNGTKLSEATLDSWIVALKNAGYVIP